jgi:hypothetical protein
VWRVAVYGTNSSGVRCPWRFGNLNNGTNGGLAYENLNNSPFNSNWNGVPWITEFYLIEKDHNAVTPSQ